MLRTSLRSVRAVGGRPIGGVGRRQWQLAIASRRCYADDKKPSIHDPKPAKLPESHTTTAPNAAPSIEPESKTASSRVDPKDVPRSPPAPETVAPSLSATSTVPTPSPAAPVRPKKKGFFPRLRNYMLTLVFLGAVTFGAGVWYSRINDNFHDFFTEFVPYGEQAVLYLEEMEMKRRYPGRVTGASHPKESGAPVKIAPQSGASWRVADSGDADRKTSAVQKVFASKESASDLPVKHEESAPKARAMVEADKKVEAPGAKPAESSKTEAAISERHDTPIVGAKPEQPKQGKLTKEDKSGFQAPEVDEPSRFPPAAPIDPLKVNDANEPVVQDLVKMLNDIITVVNADNADDRFSATIGKAKNELNKIGSKIRDMKAQVEKDAAAQVGAKVDEFEKAANLLVGRVEKTLEAQEHAWREEFETEMKHVREMYDARVKIEMERERQINEQKLNNTLVEQAVELKRQFANEIKQQVENERNERLGKLEKLGSAVRELEKLTAGWNDVVDMNLKTQQFHVAVEAVRASLYDSEHPRPFVRELVALREIASDDEVVNAAIASINPSAYQRGISTPAHLIDRFRNVASEVRKASLLPEDAGVASHASSFLLSKVMFKKHGLAQGDDVESILTRTQTFLEEGDLDSAAREMNGLTGWAKALSRDWLAEVRKVLEVQQALDVIATEARLQSLRVEG